MSIAFRSVVTVPRAGRLRARRRPTLRPYSLHIEVHFRVKLGSVQRQVARAPFPISFICA